MKLLIAILLSVTFCLHGHSEMEKLIAEKSQFVKGINYLDSAERSKYISFPVEEDESDLSEASHAAKEAVLSQILSQSSDTQDSEFLTKKLSFETYAFFVEIINGFTFHVADYYDGTRVVTCLDDGYQVVGVHGIQVAESYSVNWHKKYFVHYYPHGKIYTYLNKQVIELKY